MNESPYYKIERKVLINSFEELIDLTIEQRYGNPGIPPKEKIQEINKNNLTTEILHNTSGIFRGQSQNWPLIPSSYRNKKYDLKEGKSDIKIRFRYYFDNYELDTFCNFAKQQNDNFPKSKIEQMIIAQHYGIKTPLLDWTKNIFVAIYFALDLKRKEDDNINFEPFIYHLKDEKLLNQNIEKEQNIEKIRDSAFVKALPIDRRVERQFSCFSFHPHPLHNPEKIPVDEYQISGELFMKLWKLMKGLGFSSSHYFPDYAGLADRIKKGFMI